MINKVEIAGVNTANLPLLSDEEKKELLKKIKDGDIDAREKFIARKFKTSIISNKKVYTVNGENADDIFQVGCVRPYKSN